MRPENMKADGWRRFAIFGVLALSGLAIWFGAPWVERMLFTGDFDFTDLERPVGFRRIGGAGFSGTLDPLAGDPLAGLNGGSDTAAGSRAIDLSGRRLCQALFGAEPSSGVVPIAYFSDYRCPYCRVLSEHLAALEQANPYRVRITWHEWPIFGKPRNWPPGQRSRRGDRIPTPPSIEG